MVNRWFMNGSPLALIYHREVGNDVALAIGPVMAETRRSVGGGRRCRCSGYLHGRKAGSPSGGENEGVGSQCQNPRKD